MRGSGVVRATVFGLALIGAAVAGCDLRPLPSDTALRSRFVEHRADLEALAAKALADSQLVGAGHDPVQMRFVVYVRDSPRSDRRLGQGEVNATGRFTYRTLLDRAGLGSISRQSDGGAVWFPVGGGAGSGAMKGIVYSVQEPTPLRGSLDGLERAGRGYIQAAYVSLGPHWYLYLHPKD